jgi:hypothetical protein
MLDQDFRDAVKIRTRDGVLQPRERRLAGQRRPVGKSFAGHLQGRVVPQRVRVVGVLVAAGDLEDPLFEHVQELWKGQFPQLQIREGIGHAFFAVIILF